MTLRPALAVGLVLLSIWLLSITCSENGPIPPSERPVHEQEGEVDDRGAIVQISDPTSPLVGVMVDIPEGALSEAVTVSINEVGDPPMFYGDALNWAVDLQPSGVNFSESVIVTLPWPANADSSATLCVYAWPDSATGWTPLETVAVDDENRLIICRTKHFSVHTVRGSEVEFVVELLEDCGQIAAEVRLNTPLSEMETSDESRSQRPWQNIRSFHEHDPGAINTVFTVTLKRRGDHDEVLETIEVTLYSEGGPNRIGITHVREGHETDLKMPGFSDWDVAEDCFKGIPLVFNFANPDAPGRDLEALYFVEVRLEHVYGSIVAGRGDNFVSTRTHAKTWDEIQQGSAADENCNGIIDRFDRDPGASPVVEITSPGDADEFEFREEIRFEGSAEDPEDGVLAGGALEWSSTLDGVLGHGETVATAGLSVGVHRIELKATDHRDNEGKDYITITVRSQEDLPSPQYDGDVVFEPSGMEITLGESFSLTSL